MQRRAEYGVVGYTYLQRATNSRQPRTPTSKIMCAVMHLLRPGSLVALAAIMSVCTATHATDAAVSAATGTSCTGPGADCVAVGSWNFSIALGAGVRTNPLVHGQDLPLVLIPQFSYYGKRFFIDNLDLGYTLLETDSNSLSLVASPGYDRVFFYRSDLQNIFVGGLPTEYQASGSTPGATPFPARQRDITYLAGPEWTFKAGIVSAQMDLLHEVTDQNHGSEIRAALGLPLLQSRGTLTADIGLTWKSARIVNYYYGAPDIYRAGAALDPFIKLGYSLPLTRSWRLSTFAQYEHLANAIAHSPIVAEHYVATAFIGVVHSF
jgi:outer membrane protein